MKYVAFLDILGFKNKLTSMSHNEVSRYIIDYSTTAFRQWENENISKLKGYIVSDSFIIYTEDISDSALNELVRVISDICKKQFSDNSILLRGAVAKGPFDKIEAKEISSLQKGLIVGQAYVDAYLMEGTVKSTGIVLSKEVFEDLQNIGYYSNDLYVEKIKKQSFFILRYLTLDFLLNEKNMSKFVDLAIESNWRPHYYNTLYFALKGENNNNKVYQVFSNIINIVGKNHPSENWRNIDLFIKNAFNDDVINEFKTRFLKYIRSKL